MTLKGRRVGRSAAELRVVSGPKRATGPVRSRLVTFWCRVGHTTTVRLAADIDVPQTWQCGRCGAPAGPDPARPPPPAEADRGRTHLECVQMRRTPEEGERALDEALARVRARREAGQLP